MVYKGNAMRGADHYVHLVKDLDEAALSYTNAGFSVGARNMHPWGTHNRIVQFPGFFIEILQVVTPSSANPFAAKASELSAKGFEGGAMLVLEGQKTDAQDYEKRGLGGIPLFTFSREGEGGKVGFDIAFAKFHFQTNRPYPTPDLAFFTCLQLAPEKFWDKAKQQHKNGVTGLEELVFVSENPADYADFFGHFTGQREMYSGSLGILLELPRGKIRITDPASFKAMYGVNPPSHAPLALAGMVFKGEKPTTLFINNTFIKVIS
jgi:hypothetical protein